MDSGTQNQGPKLKHRQNIEFFTELQKLSYMAKIL